MGTPPVGVSADSRAARGAKVIKHIFSKLFPIVFADSEFHGLLGPQRAQPGLVLGAIRSAACEYRDLVLSQKGGETSLKPGGKATAASAEPMRGPTRMRPLEAPTKSEEEVAATSTSPPGTRAEAPPGQAGGLASEATLRSMLATGTLTPPAPQMNRGAAGTLAAFADPATVVSPRDFDNANVPSYKDVPVASAGSGLGVHHADLDGNGARTSTVLS